MYATKERQVTGTEEKYEERRIKYHIDTSP
jgi:hypothetical protein